MGKTLRDETREAIDIEIASRQIPETVVERITVLNECMGSNDPKKKAQAVAILRAHPDAAASHYLAEVEQTINRIIGLDNTEVMRQLLLNEADKMRVGLRSGRPREEVPYAERLLIERVIACRFQLTQAEDACQGSMSLAQGEYRQRCCDRAHRKYMGAIKALAEVRRLALPLPPSVSVALPGSTLVNIGEKQINVATGVNQHGFQHATGGG